jgi:hypothetical protein
MHRITVRISTLLLAAGLVAIAAACTTTTAEPEGSGSSTNKKDSGKTSSEDSDDEDDSKVDSGSSKDDDTKNCSSETTAETCVTCCGYDQAVDDKFAEADEAYIQCACEGTCGASCGSFCTDPQAEPTTACIDCLDSQAIQTSCGPKADEICEKDTACKAFLACEEASGCLDKPMPDAG